MESFILGGNSTVGSARPDRSYSLFLFLQSFSLGLFSNLFNFPLLWTLQIWSFTSFWGVIWSVGNDSEKGTLTEKQKRWLSRNLTPPRFLVQVLRQAPVPPRGIVKEWEPEALNLWSSPPHVRFKRNNGQKESSENGSWANRLFLSKCLWFRQGKKYETRSGLRCKRAIKELSTGIQKAPF